ncbi:hypothetical protein GCM10023115_40730 [Pontixanthobacter gangjinensis]|uniref:Tetratricopeptide repeat protein n=1 Tax=Christiangramia aestuarii TaxID=1028746 RepID=A0A7K1LRW2_9FLAO|nr:tetratricopeptide repeat protein [Christiangramia aestuarii]MUP43542.1 tetratricopeptide repeat protein [Christiangramia aestuarii]
MATYKKRGYKPSNKEEKEQVAEQESTTAEVFNTLDEGASRTETWVADNQKYIYIIVGVAIVAVLGYLGYNRFILEPKQNEAANEMAQAQGYMASALRANGAQSDSLYNLALNGGEGKYGFLDIIDNYGGTDAANLAHYNAGFAYLRTGKYQEAIEQLEAFSSDDEIFSALATGGIGDAFMQLEQPEEALGYYEKAAEMRSNSFTTPRFLLKAAITAIQIGEADAAEEYLLEIEDEYSEAPEAEKVPIYLGQARAMKN